MKASKLFIFQFITAIIVITLFAYDDYFLQHRTGDHPERPARLTSIIQSLRRTTLWPALLQVKDQVKPDDWITLVHSPEYVERLKQACDQRLPFIDTPDSSICDDSYDVARLAVGKTLGACDLIVSGEARNGFIAVRPPGHHAEFDCSLGFCLFNNIAIAARYLQQQHGIKKILIFDFDVHHGNGTQNTFYADDTVFYGSIHQHPATLFPGTGWPNEFGDREGRGYTLNLPMEPGAGDEEFLDLFYVNFLPMAKEFKPDFVLLSAGFDGHRKDPLSQINQSEDSFIEITKAMTNFADNYCQGRLLSVLEGGYHLGALSACVISHLHNLSGYVMDKTG